MIKLIIIFIIAAHPHIEVYFQSDTLSRKLAYFIGGAHNSLDICFHQFYEDEVIDSTLAAWNRGVNVRVITEHDYINYYGVQRLKNAGIPVIDEGYGANTTLHRMHNKFIVRDFRNADTTDDMLWMGSFNASGTTMADNAIIIKSPALARIFEIEFNQMWGDTDNTPNPAYSLTGSNKYDQSPYHNVIVDNILISAYFSPYNRISNIVLDLINEANHEIDFLMFTFTRYSIYSAMGTRYSNGIFVYGVLEGQQDYNRNAYDYFQAHHIPVYYDNFNSGNGTYLHDKIMITDDSIVFTGSYNFTYAADTSNDESVLILHSPEVAELYKEEFIRRYNETGHTYEIKELSQHIPYTNKSICVMTQKDFALFLKHHKKTVYRLDGQRIFNTHKFTGIIFYKEDNVWKRALIIK